MVLGLEGEKCEICGKILDVEKTWKDVDMKGYTHNFCQSCYDNKTSEVEQILNRKKQTAKHIS